MFNKITLDEIELLDGYEFETLVLKLFKKMGFDAEQTKLSGDGGVDIIATSNITIYKGKYLIQCKKFSGSIGEPVIRDLYGVVLSERANKGIVVTNSIFTKGAIDFAEDKNIELVDGDVLNKLLYENHLIDNLEIQGNHFTDHLDFDVDKYNYLKRLVATNKTQSKPYEILFEFLYSYILQNRADIIYDGLIEECLLLSQEIVKRFSRKKNDIEETQYLVQCYLYFLLGNIEKVFEIAKMRNYARCVATGGSYGSGPAFSLNRWCQVSEDGKGINWTIESGKKMRFLYEFHRCLLILFIHLRFDEGIEYCNELLKVGFNNKVKQSLEAQKSQMTPDILRDQCAEKNIKLFQEQYKAVINKKDTKIYIVDNHGICSVEYFTTIEEIVLHWKNDIDLEKQLKDIKIMLDM